MEHLSNDIGELVEFWTLLDEDRVLLEGKRGTTALGFALLLKHYSRHGRFPRSSAEVSDAVVGSWPARWAFPQRTLVPTSGLAARSSTTAARSVLIWAFGSPQSMTKRS
jgi:hypothetical protein